MISDLKLHLISENEKQIIDIVIHGLNYFEGNALQKNMFAGCV